MLLIEVADVAWKKWRVGEVGRELAMLMPSAAAPFVALVPSPPFTEAALALDLDHAAYDCYFLPLAEHSGRQSPTTDDRFVATCRGSRVEALIEPLRGAR